MFLQVAEASLGATPGRDHPLDGRGVQLLEVIERSWDDGGSKILAMVDSGTEEPSEARM